MQCKNTLFRWRGQILHPFIAQRLWKGNNWSYSLFLAPSVCSLLLSSVMRKTHRLFLLTITVLLHKPLFPENKGLFLVNKGHFSENVAYFSTLLRLLHEPLTLSLFILRSCSRSICKEMKNAPPRVRAYARIAREFRFLSVTSVTHRTQVLISNNLHASQSAY